MLVTGLPLAEFRQIVARASAARYGGNVIISNYREYSGTRFSYTLRAKDTHGPGARRSSSGRRNMAACWHAHRDVLMELFARFPQARVRTHRFFVVDYRGADSFREQFPGTGYENIGWDWFPVAMTDLCECYGNVPRTAKEHREAWESAFAREFGRGHASDAFDETEPPDAHAPGPDAGGYHEFIP